MAGPEFVGSECIAPEGEEEFQGLERNQSHCVLLRFVQGRRSLVVAST